MNGTKRLLIFQLELGTKRGMYESERWKDKMNCLDGEMSRGLRLIYLAPHEVNQHTSDAS